MNFYDKKVRRLVSIIIQQEKPRGKKAVLNWYLTIRILSGVALQ